MDKQTESLARQEFEKWLRTQPHVLNVGVSESGSYVLREDRIAWSAWKASRESLVVDFEKCNAQGYDEELYDSAVEDCAKAVRAIGIRIKGEEV